MTKTLLMDLVTGQRVTYRTYARPQLWHAELSVTGTNASQHVEATDTVRPHDKVRATDLIAVVHQQLTEMAAELARVDSMRLMLYRRSDR